MQFADTLPCIRKTGVVLRAVGPDSVVYDTAADTAHALSPLAAKVWPLCDGSTTVTAAARALDASAEQIVLAVAGFERAGLVQAAGHERRAFLQRAAMIGGGAATLPVLSMLAPVAAAAASMSTGTTGTTYSLYTSAAGATPLSAKAGQFSFLACPAGSAGAYTPVTTQVSDGDVTAVRGASATQYGNFPIFAVNPSGSGYAGDLGTIPAMTFDVHPAPDMSAVVGFTLPRSATSFTASFTISDNDAAAGSNGVAFALFKGTTRIPAGDGSIPNGGRATVAIPMTAATGGDVLYLIVDPKDGDFGGDSTRVDFSVTVS